MMKKIITTGLLFTTVTANAAVINSTDVSGFTTFQDTNTGLVWLDMDNFFDQSGNNGTSGFDMISAADNAGFTFATVDEVHTLLDTLSLGSGEWQGYADVMGYGQNRDLIWGMYDDGDNNPYGYSWSWSSSLAWNFQDNATYANLIQNDGSYGAEDMGIWAFQVVSVPEPSLMALFGVGLLGLGIARRKVKK